MCSKRICFFHSSVCSNITWHLFFSHGLFWTLPQYPCESKDANIQNRAHTRSQVMHPYTADDAIGYEIH